MDFNYLTNFNNLLSDIEGNNIEQEQEINIEADDIDTNNDFKNRTKPKYKSKPLNKIFVIPSNNKSKNKY